MVAKFLDDNKRDDGDGNEKWQKSNRFRLAKQQLCTFCTLRCLSLHDCDLKPSKFMRPIYGVGEYNTKNVLLFFVNLDTVLWDSTQIFREHLTN